MLVSKDTDFVLPSPPPPPPPGAEAAGIAGPALRSTETRLGAAAAFVGESGGEAPAWATDPEPCPTFFPDFRCERSGRYDDFVMPMSDPYIFEDPFITTGVYVWGLWHEFPHDSIFGGGKAITSNKGGDVWAIAVQARLAITDRGRA